MASTRPCPSRWRLAQSLIDRLGAGRLENPSGRWHDYNPDYDLRQLFACLNKTETLCQSDVPDEPDTDDYSDLDLSRTRTGRPVCCDRSDEGICG
jgi:hypothetical protein